MHIAYWKISITRCSKILFVGRYCSQHQPAHRSCLQSKSPPSFRPKMTGSHRCKAVPDANPKLSVSGSLVKPLKPKEIVVDWKGDSRRRVKRAIVSSITSHVVRLQNSLMNHADNISVINLLSATTPGNDGRWSKNLCTSTTVIRRIHRQRTKSGVTRDFLTNKIKMLKIAIDSKLNSLTNPPFPDPLHIRPILESLPNVKPYEVFHLLKSMPAKSSLTDCIPTSLLCYSNVFSEFISHVANLSFCHACFPSSFKIAQVTPRIKNLVPTKTIHLITVQFLTSIPYQRY